MNTPTKKKYRKAFIAQNTGHDFTGLKSIANDLVFITNGYEEEDALPAAVANGLKDFDPRQDVIVPVGNVFVNILIGNCLAHLSEKDLNLYDVALFRDKEYHTRFISLRKQLCPG